MAETNGQEKTEQATPKRLEKASEEGQVAYSKEITDALLFIGVILYLFMFGGHIAQALQGIMRRSFTFEDLEAVDKNGIGGLLTTLARDVGDIVLPIFGAVLLVIVLGGLAQVGAKFSLKRIEPKPNKLDPIKGLKKIFSVRSVMTVLTQTLKLLAVGLVSLTVIASVFPLAGNLALMNPLVLLELFPATIFEIGFKVAAVLVVLAVADLLFQRWKHSQDMKMTKQEVKDESKQTDGDPQVKGRIRQMQRERARMRMLADVKEATVVVRNPTHFAVALKYEPGKDAAPVVVAKGKNYLALRIIEIAEKAGVPVKSDPPLARQLYPLVRVGKVIPEDLFRAVAQILAWVYRKQGMHTFEVPPEDRAAENGRG